MPKKGLLTLHIGHPKTGSSALQSLLARESVALAEHGVHYPSAGNDKNAAAGRISVGNGKELRKTYKAINAYKAGTVLISSEHLFFDLLDDDFRHNLHSHAAQMGLSPSYVLYTRDLFEFAFSGWGQYVKRSRGTLDFEAFMLSKDSMPFNLNGENFDLVKRWIDLSREEDFALRIYNYERHKRSLTNHFLATVLHLNSTGFDTNLINRRKINRSLTLSEYELQRQFNLYFQGNAAPFISDMLVNELPNLTSEIPCVTRNTYDRIVEKHRDVIEEINTFVDPHETIRITPFDTLNARFTDQINGGDFVFTSEQLAILARSISDELTRTSPSRTLVNRAHSVLSKIKRKLKLRNGFLNR